MKPFAVLFSSALVLSAVFVASPGVLAQDTTPSTQETKEDGKAKKPQAPKKSKSDGKTAAKSKSGHFASEADAKAKCPGGVVWVDQNHFNHYEGSREYGVKPGEFACDGQ